MFCEYMHVYEYNAYMVCMRACVCMYVAHKQRHPGEKMFCEYMHVYEYNAYIVCVCACVCMYVRIYVCM
jgi:hypothetical protein